MRKLQLYIVFLLSAALYVTLGYFTARPQTVLLMCEFFILFMLYLWVLRQAEQDFKFWLSCAVFFRILLLFAVPNLSDDFYRFVWDGRLWNAGIHPFAQIPRYYIDGSFTISGIDTDLFHKLNSKDYFTVYPPLTQFVFWISVKLSPHSVYGSLLIMKVVVLLAELGSLALIYKISQRFKLPKATVLIYALNPLVIIELTGNLHFEALLIFFLLLSIYLLMSEKWRRAAFAWSASVCVKLLPLIFLPALLTYLGWKRAFWFYIAVGLCVFIFFIPVYHVNLLNGFKESIGYYFNKFEFNASIYYAVREWGFWNYGYNIIQTVGWKLGVASATMILILSFFAPRDVGEAATRDRVGQPSFKTWLFVLLIYLLFSTTVHPWYVIPLLALSVFTPYRFPVIWSGFIFLTYVGYSQAGFEENYAILFVEYGITLAYFVVEWKYPRFAFLNNVARQ